MDCNPNICLSVFASY